MGLEGEYSETSRKNYENFMKNAGVVEEHITRGKNATVQLQISKSGDQWTVKRVGPLKTISNTFTIGVSKSMEIITGKTIKEVTVSNTGGDMVESGNNYKLTRHLSGTKLSETITYKGCTMEIDYAQK